MEYCTKCGKTLRKNDIGFHKKMVNRGAEKFMCIDCLCDYFEIPTENAYKMIERFKQSGCTLF